MDISLVPNVSAPSLFPALAVSGSVMWALFVFVAVVWIIATAILEYHWKTYAVGEQKISSARFLYRTGSCFFLIIIFLTAISYSLS